MENKKSFIAYVDWGDVFEALPDEKAGQLAKHLWRYVSDKNPVTDDVLINAVFAQIKATLKRDLKKWESEIEIKSNSGRLGNIKRWNPDLYEFILSEKITLEDAELIAKNRKTSHSDTLPSHPIANIAVNDNVSVSVNDNDIEEKKVFNFKKSIIDLGIEKGIVEDWLKVRKTKKATNSETAFKGIKNEIERAIKHNDITANDCIKTAVEKSWAGFNHDWITKINNNGTHKQNNKQPRFRQVPNGNYKTTWD